MKYGIEHLLIYLVVKHLIKY
jgi:hypothetical protein